MSFKCPVTNKTCPYLKKLDSDVCPREHECEAVKISYSEIGQKPPAPKKFLTILFSALIILLASISIIYFFILDGGVFSENTTTPTTEPTPSVTLSIEPTLTSGFQVTTTTNPPPASGTLPQIIKTANPAEKPVRITLDSLEIIAEIRNVPLDENGNISVIFSSYIISWYEGSYLPGENGSCILFGYKYYGGISGVFYSLEKLHTGDAIKFTMDNGSVVEQYIYDIIVYKDGFLTEDVLAIENNYARTVIISETGDIDSETGSYKDLIVVFAK